MDGSNYANDNEPNPWRSIGWQAALIVNRLRCAAQILEFASEQKEGGEEKPKSENQAKAGPCHHSEHVEHRLNGLASLKQKGGTI
jgi:hypothetical protein